ncbi:MAG TPA: FHA domain-containing protein [Fuerstia sp.]|nr:FHA domain-containing protein [Fuerstiella sp.]
MPVLDRQVHKSTPAEDTLRYDTLRYDTLRYDTLRYDTVFDRIDSPLESASMKVVLELQDQPSNIKKVTIRHDIVIGRGAECNLRLSAPQVSRRHCFLRIGADGAYVSDLDSSNGTYLGGKRLSSGKRYTLDDGAILAVGPVRFVASVRSEVVANEALQVHVADNRIEAEAGLAVDDSADDVNFVATLPDAHRDEPDEDGSALNFAIEQAGKAADEDEPTTDYVSSDGIEADGMLLLGLPDLNHADEPDTVAAVGGILDNDGKDVVDEVEVLEDDIVVDAEDVIEEAEFDGVDDSDLGDEESDLKNFLQGLD